MPKRREALDSFVLTDEGRCVLRLRIMPWPSVTFRVLLVFHIFLWARRKKGKHGCRSQRNNGCQDSIQLLRFSVENLSHPSPVQRERAHPAPVWKYRVRNPGPSTFRTFY